MPSQRHWDLRRHVYTGLDEIIGEIAKHNAIVKELCDKMVLMKRAQLSPEDQITFDENILLDQGKEQCLKCKNWGSRVGGHGRYGGYCPKCALKARNSKRV
jgi:hypothetical protein